MNNSSVLKYLREEFSATPATVKDWYGTWVTRGFEALEAHAQTSRSKFLFADSPGLAEICLIPQIYNARRFELDLSLFPTLLEIDHKCQEFTAFREATPEAAKPA